MHQLQTFSISVMVVIVTMVMMVMVPIPPIIAMVMMVAERVAFGRSRAIGSFAYPHS